MLQANRRRGGHALCDLIRTLYPRTLDNKASSMVNNSNSYVVLEDGHDCNGQVYIARPGKSDPTFVDNNFNDKATSIEVGR